MVSPEKIISLAKEMAEDGVRESAVILPCMSAINRMALENFEKGALNGAPLAEQATLVVAYSALRDFLLMEMDEAPDVSDWLAVWAEMEKHKS